MKKTKRGIALLLVLVMIVTIMPMTTFAGENNEKKVGAMIGTVEFETLDAAVATVKDNTSTTIKLMADIDEKGVKDHVLSVATNKEIVLDLNGHNITSDYDPYTIDVDGKGENAGDKPGKLTIIGKGTINNTSNGSTTIRNYGTLVIGEEGADDDNSPNVTTGEKTITANSAIKTEEGTSLTIYSGIIGGDSRSIECFGNANIHGGIFLNSVRASAWKGYATTMNVYGGTFESYFATYTDEETAEGNVPRLILQGGRYVLSKDDLVTEGVTVKEGLEFKKIKGYYVLHEHKGDECDICKNAVILKIDDKSYTDWEEAVKTLEGTKGKTITLLDDIKDTEYTDTVLVVHDDEEIILDLNGYNINSGSDIGTIIVAEKGKLTIVGKGSVTNDNDYMSVITNKGEVVIGTDGKANNESPSILTEAKLEKNDCVVYNNEAAKLVIYSGTIASIDSCGTTDIYGGEITGDIRVGARLGYRSDLTVNDVLLRGHIDIYENVDAAEGNVPRVLVKGGEYDLSQKDCLLNGGDLENGLVWTKKVNGEGYIVHKHVLKAVAKKEATYFKEGNIAYWECSECGGYYSDSDGTKEISDKMTVVIPKIEVGTTSKITVKSRTTSQIKLAWEPVKDATGYRLYVKKNGKFVKVKTVEATTYTVTKLTAGTQYSYAVKAYVSNSNGEAWATKYSVIDVYTAPGVTKEITLSKRKDTSLEFKWQAVSGATGYRVYIWKSGKWVRKKTLTATSCKIDKLKAGTYYKFAVKAYVTDANGTKWASSYKSIGFRTSPGVTSKITYTKGTTSIKLKWNKVTGATGYRIYMWKNSKWVKAKSSVTSTTYTKTKLKRKTTYKFAVKAYTKVGSTIIWSPNYKSVTTKTK